MEVGQTECAPVTLHSRARLTLVPCICGSLMMVEGGIQGIVLFVYEFAVFLIV